MSGRKAKNMQGDFKLKLKAVSSFLEWDFNYVTDWFVVPWKNGLSDHFSLTDPSFKY